MPLFSEDELRLLEASDRAEDYEIHAMSRKNREAIEKNKRISDAAYAMLKATGLRMTCAEIHTAIGSPTDTGLNSLGVIMSRHPKIASVREYCPETKEKTRRFWSVD